MSSMLNESVNSEEILSTVEDLNEKASASMAARIKGWFEKVRKMIETIIQKLKQWKDGFTKNAELYWSRYGKQIMENNLSNFSYKGYKYDVSKLEGTSLKNISDFISSLTAGGKVKDIDTVSNAISKALEGKKDSELAEAVSNLEKEYVTTLKEYATDSDNELEEKYVKECISGFDAPKANIREGLAKAYKGGSEKVDMKPSRDEIKKSMSSPIDISKIQKDLENLKSGLAAAERKIEKDISTIEKGLDKDGVTVQKKRAIQLARSYATEYVKLYQQIFAFAAKVNGERITAAKACNQQSLAIAKKALTYKAKSESAELTDEQFDAIDADTLVDVIMA